MMSQILVFFSITFFLPWCTWIVMNTKGLYKSLAYMAISALIMFIPLIAAFIVHLISKKKTISCSWKPEIRKNIKIYIFSWLLPPFLSILGAMAYFTLNCSSFTLEVIEEVDISPLLLIPLLLISVLSGSFLNMFFALGEEAGWRGFLTPKLSERFGKKRAYILAGVIWGLWHTPINMMGYNYGTTYPGYPISGIIAMCLFCTVMGTYASILAEKSNSIWPPTLLHGAVNASAGIGLVFLKKGESYLLGPSLSGIIPSLIAGIPLPLMLRKQRKTYGPSGKDRKAYCKEKERA